MGSERVTNLSDEALSKRFWMRVDKTDSCWNWNAEIKANGYGRFYVGAGKRIRAHRFAYENVVGPIPIGMQLDHLCRNRKCVNPAHLEIVTPRENTARGMGMTAHAIRFDICKNGHPFTPETTYIRHDGFRECKACRRVRQKVHDAKRNPLRRR